ncbi:MAG TPA: hypothetical protein VG937_00190 [Polyangiaceae bacterium]|nr:hypothetical protein [Polyangiaceae bacterium]
MDESFNRGRVTSAKFSGIKAASSAVSMILVYVGCSSELGAARSPAIGSCEGIGVNEVHETLLVRENIESVETLTKKPFVARPSPLKQAAAASQAKIIGVRMIVRPIPGLTAERLQLLVNCDRSSAERASSAAHEPTCPFGLKGATTSVHSTGIGFAADIASDDPQVVREIIRRANALR